MTTPANPKAAGARRARVVVTRKPSGRETKGIGGLFPVAYMNIIEKEASGLGQSKSGFLTMLVQRQLGEVGFERNSNAPSYELDRKELQATQHYVFYVDPKLAERIEDDQLRMGDLAANAYIITLVNNWLGKPTGLKMRESKKKG